MDDLGKNQQAVLKELKYFGRWYIDCNWVFGTPSATERVLNALVRRGLVQVEEGVYTLVQRSVYDLLI